MRSLTLLLALLFSAPTLHAQVFQGLGDFSGGNFWSNAWGVSADGSVVVGDGTSVERTEAFRWTEEDGMRSLQTVLEDDYGVDLTGWGLVVARAVSADGSVVAGLGTSPKGPEGWRADLRSAAWLDPVSGFFNEPTRWSIGDIPAEQHPVLFNAFTTPSYDVTFVQDQTTRALAVDSTQVAFDLGGATYTLAEPRVTPSASDSPRAIPPSSTSTAPARSRPRMPSSARDRAAAASSAWASARRPPSTSTACSPSATGTRC